MEAIFTPGNVGRNCVIENNVMKCKWLEFDVLRLMQNDLVVLTDNSLK